MDGMGLGSTVRTRPSALQRLYWGEHWEPFPVAPCRIHQGHGGNNAGCTPRGNPVYCAQRELETPVRQPGEGFSLALMVDGRLLQFVGRGFLGEGGYTKQQRRAVGFH